MAAMMTLLNRDYERKLWTEPLGIYAIYAGLILMAIGILVIRKIVDIKV
jgi:Flp pilus assembly protein TadB